jgi:hypothetical protein
MELKQSKVSELGKYLQKQDSYLVEELVICLVVVSLGVMALGIIFIN